MNRANLTVWTALLAMLGGLYWLRVEQLIRFDFNVFALAILAMAAGVVSVVWIVRPGGGLVEASAGQMQTSSNERE